MWVDTRKRKPAEDGQYFIQTVYGDVSTILYTKERGWNTYRDSNGWVHGEKPLNDSYVVRWYEIPAPPTVPDEWLKEHRKEMLE